MIVVELEGLEIFGHHGADEAERARGQTFLFDIRFVVPDAARSDRLADTVDYVAVAELVKQVSDGTRYHLLEALSSAVADAVVERFSLERTTHTLGRPGSPWRGPPLRPSGREPKRVLRHAHGGADLDVHVRAAATLVRIAREPVFPDA
jgi:7,8-dihydroneopterin aldolase/epimerase/oxygenase